jgi:UDP-glucose 4-epimerase
MPTMRVLVTGGAGYVGSVVAAHLLEAGHHVVVLDNLVTGHRDAVAPGATLVVGDVADPAVTGPLLSEGIEVVMHFAGSSLVAESAVRPERYYENNVVGTFRLLEAMRKAGVPALVFSSSAATYGEPEAVPITEDAPARPTNAYGATKLAIDNMVGFYCTAHGLGAVSLRYFNVAGAYRQFGERHANETHLIPIVLEVALGKRGEVEVFGTDYPTPDGTAIRDYVHVGDLSRAHVLALGACAPGRHRIYNLGCGDGFSVREVLDTCRAVTGQPIPAVESGRRAGDPARLVASNRRIGEELGWEPELDLAQMVRDAWEFAQGLTSE